MRRRPDGFGHTVWREHMKNRFTYIAPLALLGVGVATANAGLVSAEMFEVVGDPAALWGSPIASLDVNTETGYVWDVGMEVPFGSGAGSDITHVTTNVYNVANSMILNQGGDSITLGAGDRVFAYTITLVRANANTVASIEEFQVGAGGSDGNLINGRGYISNGGVESPVGGNASDFTDLGFFWAHDWLWGPEIADQLQNEQTLTVLLFADPSIAVPGTGVIGTNPGQVTGADGSSNIPVLVPQIPTPGTFAFGLIAGAFGIKRSRRGE